MCTPLIDRLKMSMELTRTSVRSTRLKCLEVTESGHWPQNVEPLVYTFNQLSSDIRVIDIKIDSLSTSASSMNGKTDPEIVVQLHDAARQFSFDIREVIDEATVLRDYLIARGVSSDELDDFRDDLSAAGTVHPQISTQDRNTLIGAAAEAIEAFFSQPTSRA